MAFTGLCGFLIGVWSITRLVEHLILKYIFFEKVYGPTPSILLANLSDTFTQGDLGIKIYYCYYAYLGISGAIAWQALGVPWFPQFAFLERCLA